MSDKQKLLTKIILLFILLALYCYSFLAEIGFCFDHCRELDFYKDKIAIYVMPFVFTGLCHFMLWQSPKVSWKAFFKSFLAFIAFALIDGACPWIIVVRYMP